ncbi:MAG: hypothetical protein ACTSX7_20375, partial [Alphaproteobacteria bacterium]
RRWFLKFGRLVAGNLRHSRPRASARWHLDEMVVKIRGCSGRSMTKARCSTSLSSQDAVRDQPGDCCESC